MKRKALARALLVAVALGTSACASIWGFSDLTGGDDGGADVKTDVPVDGPAGEGGGGEAGDGSAHDGEGGDAACIGCSDAEAASDACSGGSCGSLVLFGGFAPSASGGGTTLGDTWVWNGASWKQAASSGPSARYWASMATLGGAAVLFGGMQDTAGDANDTWIWNGTSWSQPNVTGSVPAKRNSAAMAALGGKVVLFGGCCGPGVTPYGDTWLWDGSAWTQASPAGATPPARNFHAMAQLGGKVVLFGGASTDYLGDTWLWDGAAWTQATVAGPSPRQSHAMATLGGKVVLFGGQGATGVLADTWVWDGGTWSCVAGCADGGAGTPTARRQAGLGALGGSAVLFGGDLHADVGGTTPSDVADTWLWNGTSWSSSAALGPSARDSMVMATLP